MTVPNETDYSRYTATGSDSAYQYTFRIFNQDELTVQTMTTAGVITTLTITTDYTVSGVGAYGGGTVTLTAGNLGAGIVIQITRIPPITQQISLQTQGAYSPTAVEGMDDLLTMISQALQTQANHAIHGPLVDASTVDMQLPAAVTRSGKFVTFDVDGSVALSTSSPAVSALVSVVTIAALKNVASPVTNTLYGVAGYNTSGDGGGGLFFWNSTSTATDNAGTVFQRTAGGAGRFLRIYNDGLNIRWFGAVGDGITDDTTAIQNCITAAALPGGNVGGVVDLDVGTFVISKITVPPACTLCGHGRMATNLLGKVGTVGKMLTDQGNAAKICLFDFAMYGNSVAGYTAGIDLGNNSTQWGTEAIMRGMWVRDFVAGYGLFLNGNVGFVEGISIWNCLTNLRVLGSTNRFTDVVLEGALGNSLMTDGAGNLFIGLEIEAPPTGFVPWISLEDDCVVDGLTFSLTSGVTYSYLISFETTTLNVNISGLTVFANTATVTNGVILHGAAPWYFLKLADAQISSYRTVDTQRFNITESLAAAQSGRAFSVGGWLPNLMITLDQNVTDDLYIDYASSRSVYPNKRYEVTNPTAKTAWITGVSGLLILTGDQYLDEAMPYPVKQYQRLSWETNVLNGGAASSILIGSCTNAYADLSSATNPAGTWVLGQILRNKASKITTTNNLERVVTVSGTAGTLAGATGAIISGLSALAVNNGALFHLYDFLTVSGLDATPRYVTAKSGNNLTVSAPANATVGPTAAITFQAPTVRNIVTV